MSYMSVFEGFFFGFYDVFSIYVPLYLGKGQYKRLSIFFAQIFFLFTIVGILFSPYILYSQQITTWLRIEPRMQSLVVSFVRQNYFQKLNQILNFLLREAIVNIHKSHYFLYLSFVLALFFGVIATALSHRFSDLSPYTIAITIRSLIETFVLVLILKVNLPQLFKYCPKWSDVKKMLNLTKYIFYSGISAYGDFLAFSVNTFYIGTRNNYTDTGAWVLFVNIYIYFIFFDVA